MSGGDPQDAATVSRAEFQLPELSGSRFEFEVTEGPSVGLKMTFDASQPLRSLVGSGPACDVQLSDPAVSRRHLALEVVGRRLRILDLESTNGTFVDGVAVRDAYLRGGETVRIGSTAFVVAEIGEPSRVALPETTEFGGVLGASPAMRRLVPLFERLAAAEVPVVIEGETGTGKELLAEALHQRSPRREAPFVVLDCTTVAPSLVESELFGHERGSFTGASGLRRGVFECADGGTLLIDEIGDLPLEIQPKLLRVLERSEFTRVGGAEAIRVDVRLLAATRRDLDSQVHSGDFRDDLYHRIAVARVELPPLRERLEDVPLLVRYFCRQLGGDPTVFDERLLRRWKTYSWPGNVRELKNAVARRLALGELADSELDPSASSDQPALAARGDLVARVLAEELPLTEARQQVIDAFEARYIQNIIEQHGGNVTRAAAAAGVDRRHFYRLRAKAKV